MLKHLLFRSVLTATAYGSFAAAGELEFGTADEAKAMLRRAVVAISTDKSSAINKFNHNDAQFRDRDLFVFCFNATDGKFTAHEAMVTRDVRKLRDPNGKAFGAEIYATAQEDRISEVRFISPIPGSTELAVKRAYVVRIED